MDPTRLEQAERIFNEVADLPKGERTRVMHERCGDDGALAHLVTQLLSHDSAGQATKDPFLSRLTSDEPALRVVSSQPLRIGAYAIVRLIGEGGMGTVYEARQENPRRAVALKVIRGWFAPREMVARLRREAQLLGAMHHPGIAAIYEAGVGKVETARGIVGEQPYIAMELVRGLSLMEHVRAKGLSVRERLALLALVCDAVQHAHTRGVIHRDLKPSNILVDEEGQPKVLDFGVARATDSDVHATTVQTDAGRVIGTLQYMSPEQVQGNSSTIDPRADVYALGAVLYELLSGRPPLDLGSRTVPEAARIIGEEEPTRLSTIDPALRGDVETIVAKALAKEKERRYATAGALAADIRRFLHDEPIEARPTSTFYQLRKFAKRNKVLVGGVLGVIVALTLGLIGTGVFAAKTERARAAASDSAAEARRAAYRSSIAAAQAALLAGNGSLARQSLDQAPPELRGWEWRHLDWMADRRRLTIDLGEGLSSDMAISRDGTTLFTSMDSESVIRMWDVRTGAARGALDTGAPGGKGLAVSPDGERLAVSVRHPAHRSLVMLAIRSGERLWHKPGMFDFSNSAFSPDGELLYCAARSSPIEVLAAATGEPRGRVPLPGRVVAPSLTVTPDGRRLLVTTEADGSILCFDTRTGGLAWRSAGSSSIYPRVSAGSPIVLACDAMLSMETGQMLRSIDGDRTFEVDATAINAASSQAAFYSPMRGITVFDPLSGEPLSVLSPPDGVRRMHFVEGIGGLAVLHPRSVSIYPLQTPSSSFTVEFADTGFSAKPTPAGDSFITSGWGDVRRWNTSDLAEVWTTVASRGACSSLDISPDGSHVAVTSELRTVSLLSTDTGALQRTFSVPEPPGPVAWSVDGRMLKIGLGREIVEMDAATGALGRRFSFHGEPVRLLESAPGRTVLASVARTELKVWDSRTGAVLRSMSLSGRVITVVRFSSSGDLLAVGTEQGLVVVWRTDDWSEIMRIELPQTFVSALGFSKDEDRLVMGSTAGTIFVWSIAEGMQMLVIPTEYGNVTALSYSSDGSTLYAMGASGVSEFATRETGLDAAGRDVARRARQFLLAQDARQALRGRSRLSARVLRVSTEQFERIDADREMDPDVRAAALRLTAARGDNPNWLNSEAWRAARDPMATPDDVRRGVRMVEKALQIFPDDTAYLNTLGILQYRAREYEAATRTLERGIELIRARDGHPYPEDLLFLALARHGAGDAKGTDDALAEMRRVMPRSLDVQSDLYDFILAAEPLLGPLRPPGSGAAAPSPQR